MAFQKLDEILTEELYTRIDKAKTRYGDFASTHEALGVALEEWDELRSAVKANALASVEWECFDLAAVLIRLAVSIRDSNYIQARSLK